MGILRRLLRKVDRLERRPTPVLRATPRSSLSLLEWTRKYLSSMLSAGASPFHVWLCETLDGLRPGERRLTQAARGYAKSSYVSFAYPLREALEGRQPFTLILSDTGKQARRFIRQIRREIESNEAMWADYPGVCAPGEVWRDDWLSLPNGCEIAAVGSGGRVRGIKSASNRRPTAIVLDDVQRKEHVVSALQRERALEWLSMDVMPAGAPETRFFVVGTPMHREDVVCTLERTAGWSHSRWPAILEMPRRLDLWREFEALLHTYDVEESERESRADAFYLEHKEEMDAGAVLCWPERFPLLALWKLRASMGAAAFEAEYQCSPTDPASCEWPPQYLEGDDLYFDDWPDKLLVKTVSLDPSKGKDARQGDYSAIIRFGRDRFGVEYVEADLARRPVNVMCDEYVRHCREFAPHGAGLESTAFQELLAAPIQAAAKAAGIEVPLYLTEPHAAKVVRIRTLTTALAQRRLRFKRRSPGTQLLIQQLRDFPVGTHDDGPDALVQARQLAIDLTSGKAIRRKGDHRR